eukprot:6182140-Pleurochrysis_carterae.AAC.3
MQAAAAAATSTRFCQTRAESQSCLRQFTSISSNHSTVACALTASPARLPLLAGMCTMAFGASPPRLPFLGRRAPTSA